MSENEKYKLNPSDAKKYKLNLEVLKKKVVGFHFVEEKNRYKVLFIEKGEVKYQKAYEIPGVELLGHVKFDDDEVEAKPLNIKLKKKEKSPEEEEKPLEEAKSVEEPKEEKVEAPIESPTEEKKEETVVEVKKLVEEFDSIPKIEGEEEKVPYGFEGVWQLENEDAIPFRDEELIIACDGLGGGGGLEVTFALTEENRKTFIRNAFIGMDLREDKKLADFCLKIVDDVFDGEGPTKVLTHAAFASRIVVSRFVYAKRHSFPDYSESYVSDDPNERPKFVRFVEPTKMMPSLMDADLKDLSYRDSVSAFISFGLMKMVKAFNMPEPPANSPLLAYTPSTLAAAIVRPNGDKLDVEVLWAGDSRIYSIDPELGFQQLSLDHEEAKGGRMTNKFTADKLALLDYAKYEKLPKNCVVFAASDGTFDPFSEFESVGVKGNLIGSMPELKDPFDFEAWEKNYFKGYTPYRGDDISIALNCYGYNGVSYFSA
ncbi:MAG: hypothetical protein II721_01180, partial [Bacilli bacterium]|nr:hypothetical protein [Bacilli bacterium]